MIGDSLAAELDGALPSDHAHQTKADDYIGLWHAVAGPDVQYKRVLDLGCGDGSTLDLFNKQPGAARWTGVDIERSPEVASRTRSDGEFVSFDGVNLPFDDRTFGFVYCRQVLEHVERPDELISEVARVLDMGGWFVGSTSLLEPFHSRSTQNITPLGLKLILQRNGLELAEIRPGIDGLTLTLRQLLGAPRLFNRWWLSESPLNRLFDVVAKRKRLDATRANAMKLTFAGHYCFLAKRPAA